jgi:uncharacterized membrane protein YvbJ
MQCTQCGEDIKDDNCFCPNCGARVDRSGTIPRQFATTGSTNRDRPENTRHQEPIPENPKDPEWRMSTLPDEDPPKRRRWLWVVVGLILFCVLLAIAFSIFLATDAGQNMLDDLATRAADLATATP